MLNPPAIYGQAISGAIILSRSCPVTFLYSLCVHLLAVSLFSLVNDGRSKHVCNIPQNIFLVVCEIRPGYFCSRHVTEFFHIALIAAYFTVEWKWHRVHFELWNIIETQGKYRRKISVVWFNVGGCMTGTWGGHLIDLFCSHHSGIIIWFLLCNMTLLGNHADIHVIPFLKMNGYLMKIEKCIHCWPDLSAGHEEISVEEN